MMKKTKGCIAALLLATASIITGCGDGAEPEFKASELTIPVSEFGTKLNATGFLAPFSVKSSNEGVAVAELSETALVVRSTGRGSATISLWDYRCERNEARIDLAVDETGTITETLVPFEGRIVKAVIKEPATISGTVGSVITPATIKLTLDNNDFQAVTKGDDLSDWIDNLPQGLKAEAVYVQGGEHIHEVSLEVSGNPSAASGESIRITIPPEHTAMQVAVRVDPRQDDALFAINPAD